jgi:hypothetical protein
MRATSWSAESACTRYSTNDPATATRVPGLPASCDIVEERSHEPTHADSTPHGGAIDPWVAGR